jgi:uncharacterized protein YcgL (UPF0745 family)
MKIDIYNSTKTGNKYLSVAKGTKIEELQLPADFDQDLLTLSPFRTRLELDLSKQHPALDQADIIKQIEEKGYATHGAKTEIKLAIQA